MIDQRQPALDIEDEAGPVARGSEEAPLPITGERAGYLIEAIEGIYRDLGFDAATGEDRVF